MKRFKNIVYYADKNHDQCHALQRAIKLAHSNNSKLTIIDVLSESDMTLDINQRYGLDINLMRSIDRNNELKDMVNEYDTYDVEIFFKVLVGIPFIELIKTVHRNNHDLLIKVAQGDETLMDRFFGSCDMHLLRKCPCPVWIEGPDSASPYKNILAAVDPSDDNCDELNTLIMDLSTSLAKRESAELNVVHAWQLEGESTLRSPRIDLSKSELDLLLSAAEFRHKDSLEKLISRYDLSLDNGNINLIKAVPYQGIISTADDLDSDLIVMGTVGRTGIPGFFIGNTAEDVLQNTSCSVLAVKPKGFKSPVLLDD